MALAPETLDRISRHWAERLDCSPTAFEDGTVTVRESTTPDSIRLLRRDESLVVGTPAAVRDSLASQEDSLRDAALPATTVVERALADSDVGVDATAGPYFLGYIDVASFTPVESDARLLVGADEPAFERLRGRVPDEEWAFASPTFRLGRTAGLFRDGDLVAVATLTHSPFPDVGVVVAPEHRGRGYGCAVVSKITATAFDADADVVVRYRTRESAPASVALAESLGYERWARSAVLVLDQSCPP